MKCACINYVGKQENVAKKQGRMSKKLIYVVLKYASTALMWQKKRIFFETRVQIRIRNCLNNEYIIKCTY